MKRNIKILFSMIGLPLALSLGLLVSCGNDNTAPYNALITFSPKELNFSIGADTCFNSRVNVFYADGTPMPGAALTISGAFADPRQGSGSRYFLYSGPCSNPPNAANLQDGNGFAAVTDDSGGFSYSVVVSVGTGTFSDTINAYSGVVYGAQLITYD